MRHYDDVVTEALALAAEAKIRANAAMPGWVAWECLAENLYHAAVTATDGMFSSAALGELCQAADETAIERVEQGSVRGRSYRART